MIYLWQIVHMICFINFFPGLSWGLTNTRLTIPTAVRKGDNALLICNYDLENDTLYTVKWYKGRREFYRYTPKENPAMKTFPLGGITVDVSTSVFSHLYIFNLLWPDAAKNTDWTEFEASNDQKAFQIVDKIKLNNFASTNTPKRHDAGAVGPCAFGFTYLYINKFQYYIIWKCIYIHNVLYIIYTCVYGVFDSSYICAPTIYRPFF